MTTPLEYMYTRFLGEGITPYITLSIRKNLVQDEQVAKIAKEKYLSSGGTFPGSNEEINIGSHPDVTVEDIISSISISQPKGEENGQIVLITATAKSPELAVDMANAITLALKDYLKEYATKKLREAIDYAKVLMQKATEISVEEEKKLEELRVKMGGNPLESRLGEEIRIIKEAISKLEMEKINIANRILENDGHIKNLETKLELLKTGKEDENIPVELPKTDLMKDLEQKIFKCDEVLMELRQKYTYENPLIENTIRQQETYKIMLEVEKKNLESQRPKFLEEKKKILLSEYQKNIAGLKEEHASQSKKIENVDNQIDEYNKKLNELEIAAKEVASQRERYLLQQKRVDLARDEFLRVKKEKEAMEQKLLLMPEFLEIGSIAKFSAAATTTTSKQLPFAIIVASLIGLGIGFLRDYLDGRIRGYVDVSRFNLSVLGTVPLIKRGEKTLIKDCARVAPIYNVYERIATTIGFVASKDNIKTFSFTSSYPGEGKSTITANIGTVLGQMGKKTLLVDTDMRCPMLHKLFAVDSKSAGLSTYLSSENVSPETAAGGIIKSTTVENLSLIPAGPIVQTVFPLLQGQNMKSLISYLKTKFDLVLFDVSPIAVTADPLVIAHLIDSTIIVVSCNETYKEQLIECKRTLSMAGAKISGVILNRSTNKDEGGYYYYYSYSTPNFASKVGSLTSK